MQSDSLPTPTTTTADPPPPPSYPSIPCSQPQFHVIPPPPVNGGTQIAYPNTGSQPWVPQQMVYPNPIGFQPWPEQAVASYPIPNVIQPLVDMNLLQFASSNPTQTPYWPNPFPQIKSRKRKLKTSQSVQCEICNIHCNTLEVYEKHLSGKKHLKTLKKNYPPQTTQPSQPTPQPVANDSTLENVLTTCNVPCNSDKASEDNVAGDKDGDQDILITTLSDHGKDEAPSRSVDEVLDAKKQKLSEGEVLEESVLLCSTDNAPCGDNVTSADHLSEEKHNIQVTTITTEIPSVSPTEDLGTKKQKLIQGGVSARSVRICTICNIVCNSEVVFADHILGKRHIGLVQKSGGVGNVNQPTPPPEKNPPQNLNSKRKKAMPRVCTLCNVACNSDVVFNLHLAGQKHNSVLKRMGLTEVQPPPPPAPMGQ